MAIRTNHISKRAVTNSRLGADAIRHGYVYEEFKENPVTAKLAGGAASGTTGDTNVLLTKANAFEYHIKGTQTITAPSRTATGLNIAMDQTDNDGVEITNGILSRGDVVFVAGTDGAFSFRVKMKIADVSGTDDCAVGFRKAEAYQANLDDYDEMACLNVISGDIKIETILNNGATTTTDTTANWADNETHILKVKVSAARAVTYEIDGAAPATTAAFTFDAGEVLVPFLFFLHDAHVCDTLEIIEWECGLDSEA